jgi:spermidine/putrescine transport system ATP-binding protein
MQIELKRIQTEVGLTFVHVTHDQEEAMTMADTIAVMNSGVIEQMGDPASLYERPSTTFTANFLGQSNLLSAAVSGTDGDDLVLDVGGQKLRLPSGRAASTQGNVWLGVRPEKLQISDTNGTDTKAGFNSLEGDITDASFIGVATQYLVRLPWGQEISAVQQNDGTRPRAAGERVRVTWACDHGFALDAAQDAHAGEEREALDPAAVG